MSRLPRWRWQGNRVDFYYGTGAMSAYWNPVVRPFFPDDICWICGRTKPDLAHAPFERIAQLLGEELARRVDDAIRQHDNEHADCDLECVERQRLEALYPGGYHFPVPMAWVVVHDGVPWRTDEVGRIRPVAM